MAIFGFHFVLTLIAVTVFSKINSRFSICECVVIRGLYYYLLEGNLIPVNFSGKEQKRRKKQEVQEEEDRLFKIPLTSKALVGVPFYGALFWTYNYFVFALGIYFVSDCFEWIFPQNCDRNTSVIWVVCAIFFFLHVLCRLAAVKLSSSELHAERNVIVCFAAIFFLVAMVFVMFSDSFFDLEFQNAYRDLVASLNKFLTAHGYSGVLASFRSQSPMTMNAVSEHNVLFDDTIVEDAIAENASISHSSTTSPLLFLIALTLVFTMVGAAFLFPCFQYAANYLELSEKFNERPLMKFTLHVTFFLPLFTFLMFTKPVKEHFMKTSGISNTSLDALRILIVILWAVLRCGIAKFHLQTFLDQPTAKVIEMKRDQVKLKERQTKVAYYASHFCATALQYFLPVFVTLSAALLLKSLGDIQFSSLIRWSAKAEAPPNLKNLTNKEADYSTMGALVLEILLSAQTQKALWTLCLIALLGMQSVLTVIGVIFKRIDMGRV